MAISIDQENPNFDIYLEIHMFSISNCKHKCLRYIAREHLPISTFQGAQIWKKWILETLL